jgi:hypothetical protein
MPTTIFPGGLPTEPELAKLDAAFLPVKTPGFVIKHEEFEAVIGSKRATPRYRTVLEAWRRRILKHHNHITGPVRGVGIKFLLPDEQSEKVCDQFGQGMRKVKRAHALSFRTDVARMSPEYRRSNEHVQRVTSALILHAATAAKELPPIK